MTTAVDVTSAVSAELIRCLEGCLERVKHCVGQLSDAQLWRQPGPGMNSIGTILIHLGGNVRQHIISGVGGAADVRDRPAEFAVRDPLPAGKLLADLQATLDEAIAALQNADADAMLQPRRVQGQQVSGWQAAIHSVSHFYGHTQEIICLTRQMREDEYQFYWTPQTAEEGKPT
ncbi:DUF1572 domain-containing protein [Blastopirellula sp. JC732]|uniref:DUF1572 domain-containing protein n=1 Tax=Blastopirellula sediminis TaxID=2894196 RepID=A0A9X1SHC5_9BACT|nr:DUF1572 family protein [Blastopirellula sediminis]MCC9606690.1 DUF1572 domain-containing protein [Blastopirellula sediminis]MCC9630012.1 DUF1572 domain-containing protein [Blastopirellula sediminis]